MRCFSLFAVRSQILQPETEAVTRLCNVDEAVWVGCGHMLGVFTEVFGRRRLVGGEGRGGIRVGGTVGGRESGEDVVNNRWGV